MQRLLALSIRILIFLLLCWAMRGSAQTPIPLTGNVSSITNGATPYAGVSIQLVNCPAPISIPGTTVIAPQGVQLQADGTGLINSTIWPNDKIDCNGTTGQSQYALQYIVNGTPTADEVCYQVVSTQGQWNLNTQQPQTCTLTPPNPLDATYNNLVVTANITAAAASFASTVTFNGATTFTSTITIPARTPCSANQYMTNISTALQPVCGVISGFLTSFNGRTGPAITPASGDYNYSQIAGTPTLYYQTVQAAGVAQAQAAALNFDNTLSVTPGAGVTGVGLPAKGTAGACLNPASLTFDGQGRETAVTCGTTLADEWYTTASSPCTLATSTDSICTGTITIPAMADTNYFVTMSANATGGANILVDQNGAQTTTSIPFIASCTFTCTNTAFTITVHAHHN